MTEEHRTALAWLLEALDTLQRVDLPHELVARDRVARLLGFVEHRNRSPWAVCDQEQRNRMFRAAMDEAKVRCRRGQVCWDIRVDQLPEVLAAIEQELMDDLDAYLSTEGFSS